MVLRILKTVDCLGGTASLLEIYDWMLEYGQLRPRDLVSSPGELPRYRLLVRTYVHGIVGAGGVATGSARRLSPSAKIRPAGHISGAMNIPRHYRTGMPYAITRVRHSAIRRIDRQVGLIAF